MVRKAIPLLPAPPKKVLVGGLGIGYTAEQALTVGEHVQVDVVEIEPKIVEWQQHLSKFSNRPLKKPQLSVYISDIRHWIQQCDQSYDLICLDTDNGPDWIVSANNEHLYKEEGLTLVYSKLNEGGVVSFWSASQAPSFHQLLSSLFKAVYEYEIEVSSTLPPDYLYVACK